MLKSLLLSAVAAATAPVLAADRVGEASALNPAAFQAPPAQGAAELRLADPIYRDARLTTNLDGALEVRFADGSKLALAAASEAWVDEFAYAGPSAMASGLGAGEQVIKYTKGLFRFISGSIPKNRVRLETPLVTIGVRGTMVRTLVDTDGTTTVGVDDGEAFVTVNSTGQTFTVTPGEKVTIGPGGTPGLMQTGPVDACD